MRRTRVRRRDRTSTSAAATARSQTSAVCVMSPKSVIPVTASVSSTSTLVGARSLCTTWARTVASSGATRCSKRSSTARSAGRRPRRPPRATVGAAGVVGCPRRSDRTRPGARTRAAPARGGPTYGPTPAAAAGPISSDVGMPPLQPGHDPGQGTTAVEPGQRHRALPLSGRHHLRAPARRVPRRGCGAARSTGGPAPPSVSAGLCTFSRYRPLDASTRKFRSRSPWTAVSSPSSPHDVAKESRNADRSSSGADTARGSLVDAVTRTFWRSTVRLPQHRPSTRARHTASTASPQRER